TCGFGVSFDGGQHWPVIGVVPGIQLGSGGAFDRGTDPSVTFDKNGNAYYTCLAFNLFPKSLGSAGAVFVSRSTDGGMTWGTPVAVFNGEAGPGRSVSRFEDHQFLTTNPANGQLYLTETTPLPDPLPNAAWRSDNNLWVAVDRSTNQIYVNYADYNGGDADVKVIRVHDDGGSFSVQRITRVNNDSTASDQFFPFVTVAANGRVDVGYQARSYEPGNALL